MITAERIVRLGSETAFAVSEEARAFAAAGNRVYPFHLGDMDLPTPENIIHAAHRAMRDGKTGYAPNAGIPELRDALAADINRSRGTHYTADSVAVQPGGKPVIGKFILALMNPGDEVLYPNPGYPIYESQIEFHGGTGLPYGFLPAGTISAWTWRPCGAGLPRGRSSSSSTICRIPPERCPPTRSWSRSPSSPCGTT